MKTYFRKSDVDKKLTTSQKHKKHSVQYQGDIINAAVKSLW